MLPRLCNVDRSCIFFLSCWPCSLFLSDFFSDGFSDGSVAYAVNNYAEIFLLNPYRELVRMSQFDEETRKENQALVKQVVTFASVCAVQFSFKTSSDESLRKSRCKNVFHDVRREVCSKGNDGCLLSVENRGTKGIAQFFCVFRSQLSSPFASPKMRS